jgi:hypothetical protein
LLIEPRQVGLERTFAEAEDISALAAENLPDETAAEPCASHDLLDGGAAPEELEDGGISFLAPKIAFVLDPLGGGE